MIQIKSVGEQRTNYKTPEHLPRTPSMWFCGSSCHIALGSNLGICGWVYSSAALCGFAGKGMDDWGLLHSQPAFSFTSAKMDVISVCLRHGRLNNGAAVSLWSSSGYLLSPTASFPSVPAACGSFRWEVRREGMKKNCCKGLRRPWLDGLIEPLSLGLGEWSFLSESARVGHFPELSGSVLTWLVAVVAAASLGFPTGFWFPEIV